MPNDNVTFATYTEHDKAAVLAVLRSNTPEFFAEREEEDLVATLDDPDGPHWVLRTSDEVVGYGGFEIGNMYNRVVLTWGMVHRKMHRQGLGRFLLAHRAREAARETGGNTRWLVVDTTPHVAPFYEKCGFDRVEVWEDGYRAGFDMVVLRMPFGSAQMDRLIGHY